MNKDFDNTKANYKYCKNILSIDFSSDTYRGIYYCVMDDCDENKGGYYIEFHHNINGDVDFGEVLDYMVIHVDDEYEMSYPKKVVEEHIDNLIIELERR